MQDEEVVNPGCLSVSQLKERLNRCALSDGEIELLQKDPRKGVQELVSYYLRLREKERVKKARLHRMSRREGELQAHGYGLVAGIDEAGRGPLAGPVVAAAVILGSHGKDEALFAELDDSKKLTPAVREHLFAFLAAEAVAIGVGVVDNAVIDRMNIHKASLEAMRLAVQQLHPQPHYLLCDGFTIPRMQIPQEGIKGGDASCLSIAAASVVAKVIRDRIMNGFDALYPDYGFARHKGYATSHHHASLRLYGPSPLHRSSFKWEAE